MSESVRESVLVKADPDTIMDVIADFDAYPDWQPDFKSVEILETDEDGWATKVRFVLDAMIMTTTYTLAYSYTDTSMSWHLVEGEQVRSLDGSYTLEDQGDGTTKVTYDLQVEPAIAVPGMLKRRATKKIVDSALKGMKQRVESLA